MTSFFVEYFNNLGTQYGTKAVKSNVKIFALGRESIPAFFREWHTSEKIQHMMADGGQVVWRSGDLEGKKIGSLEGKPFTLNSLSSNPPTLLSSNNQPLPISRKGRGKCTLRFTKKETRLHSGCGFNHSQKKTISECRFKLERLFLFFRK